MTLQASPFSPELLSYMRQISAFEHPILAQIRADASQHRLGQMSIAPEQVALLAWIAQLIGAKRYLEIGTFIGYSSSAMALSLPDDAQLTCCDINVSFTDLARSYWQRAGIAHKITLHLQPAIITLDHLIANGAAQSYDLALIDADKPPTPHYYERCLKLVRSGGVIAIDNVLLNGRIIHDVQNDSPPSHTILRQFNNSLATDQRVIPLTLPLGDGLTLLLKK